VDVYQHCARDFLTLIYPSEIVLLTPQVPCKSYDASRTELTWPSRYLSLRLPGREGGTELAPFPNDQVKGARRVLSITDHLAAVRIFLVRPRARARVRYSRD
jgi:hypothetical protein